MKAVWNDQVLAEADREDLIYIERNWYFPPESVKAGLLTKSDTPYMCPWKGDCQYFDVSVGGETNKDAAFSYPEPKDSAIDIVKKDFGDYVAFWRGIQVTE
jgi:uncharacterized protein (DUF427 family)